MFFFMLLMSRNSWKTHSEIHVKNIQKKMHVNFLHLLILSLLIIPQQIHNVRSSIYMYNYREQDDKHTRLPEERASSLSKIGIAQRRHDGSPRENFLSSYDSKQNSTSMIWQFVIITCQGMICILWKDVKFFLHERWWFPLREFLFNNNPY